MALTPDDRLAVTNLLASYAFCLDSSDVEGVVEAFRPDAVWDHIGGRATGRDEIRARARFLIESGRVGGQPAHLRHFVALPRIEGDGDSCVARTYCVILDYDVDRRVRVPLLGSYEDTCVKVDGRWQLQRRVTRAELETEGR